MAAIIGGIGAVFPSSQVVASGTTGTVQNTHQNLGNSKSAGVDNPFGSQPPLGSTTNSLDPQGAGITGGGSFDSISFGNGVSQSCMTSAELNADTGNTINGPQGNGCGSGSCPTCGGGGSGDAGDTSFAGNLDFTPTSFNPTSFNGDLSFGGGIGLQGAGQGKVTSTAQQMLNQQCQANPAALGTLTVTYELGPTVQC